MGNKDTRRQTRECAMQLLYEMEIQKDFSKEMRTSFLHRPELLRDDENRNTPEMEHDNALDTGYFHKVLEAVSLNLTEIDGLLAASAENWRIDRISKVDLAVLRLSVAEIMYLEEIPDSVSINEAVELAKKFGSEDSGKFVNGVLGRITKGKKNREDRHEG